MAHTTEKQRAAVAKATAAAALANKKRRQSKLSAELEADGWITISPYREHGYISPADIQAATKLLDLAGYEVRPIGGVE